MTDRKAPEQRTVDVDVGELSTEGNRLRGHAAVFNVLSEDLGGYRERLAPGCFSDVLEDDVRLLVDHKPPPLARTKAGTLKLSQDATGLAFEADLPSTTAARDLRESVSRGDLDGASFRFQVGEESWSGDVRTVEKVASLMDVSIACFPAYPEASIELRARPTATTTTTAADEPQKESTDMSEKTDGDGAVTEERQKASPEKTEESSSSTPTDSSEAVSSSTGGLKVENRTAEPEGRSTGELVISELRQIQVGETRALSNSSASAISPPELTTFVFDKLRASSVAIQSGIPVETTDRQSVTWPRLTTDSTPAFYSEAGTIVAGDPVFDQVDVAPAKIAHRVIVSNELLDDSDPPVFQALSDNVTSTLGLKLDATVYQGGTALPGFTGMGNLAGKQTGGTITTSGVAGTASYSQLMGAVGLLRGANVPGPYVLAAHPDVGVAFQRLQDTTGQPLQPPPEAPVGYWSTQLSGTAYLYSPSSFRILTRQDATIELDRSRLFDSDQSEVRGKLRAALVAPYENAVVTLTAT